MEIGLRVLALIIDVAVCFGTLPLVMGGAGWVKDPSEIDWHHLTG